MPYISTIKLKDIVYDIKSKYDISGNEIEKTYASKDDIERVDTAVNIKADKNLSNVKNNDFYDKGVLAGLGQIVPEIQPTTEVYITAWDALSKTITLSNVKPTQRINIPLQINTNGTLVRLKYIYKEEGIISALSRWKLVLYFDSLETNKDYEFSATQSAFVGGKNYLIGGDLYNNRFAIPNPRVEIPLENNVLPTNLNRVAGDYMEIDLVITKSSGSSDTVNIISDRWLFDSKLVRNGGDIGSNNITDFNGVDLKTQSLRNREYEGSIKEIGEMVGTLNELLATRLYKKYHPSLVDVWFMSGYSNADAPTAITGVNGNNLATKNFAWGDASGFGDGEYKGSLVFDGIDDYCFSNDFSEALTDYTVICKRVRLNNNYLASKSYEHGKGAFILESPIDTYSFGNSSTIAASTDKIIYQTKRSYNGTNISSGTGLDSLGLWLGTVRDNDSRFFKGAIYYIALYDKTLSESEIAEEIDKLDTEWRKRGNVPYTYPFDFTTIYSDVEPHKLVFNNSTLHYNFGGEVGDRTFTIPSYKVKVTGLEGDNAIYLDCRGEWDTHIFISKDGIYTIPSQDSYFEGAGYIEYSWLTYFAPESNITVTLEMLPL